MFRVAEFKKIKGRQVFVKFSKKGYKLAPDGTLSHRRKKICQKDKRRKNYVELNMWSGRLDVAGTPIFEQDIVFEKKENVRGVVKFYNSLGGFVLRVAAGDIQIPYTYITDDYLFKVVGNAYKDLKK